VFDYVVSSDAQQRIYATKTSHITTPAGTYAVDWYSHLPYDEHRSPCPDGYPNDPGRDASIVLVAPNGGDAPTAYPPGCDPIIPAAALKCWNAACTSQSCGAVDSIYDADGCFKVCETDADCETTEACVEGQYAQVTCDGEDPCHCGTYAAISTKMLCRPREPQ
jgi:hypothetical protein